MLLARHKGVAVAAVMLSAGGSALAATKSVEHGPFAAEHVTLSSLRGTLEVRIVEGGDSRLVVDGPAAAVDALNVGFEAGRLVVEGPESGSSVSVAKSVTVVTGAGATSSVTIGGNAVESGAAAEPVDMVLDVPRGTGFELQGFVGDALIGDLESDVVITVVAGTTRLGAVHAADLSAVGNGRIEAASVMGDLVANVTGDGEVSVANGFVEAATVSVTGAGRIEVSAPIERAEVAMVGAGIVRLAEVAEAPVVSRVGAGKLEIGQW